MAPVRLGTPLLDDTTAEPKDTCDPAAHRVLAPHCAQRCVGHRWSSGACPIPPSCVLSVCSSSNRPRSYTRSRGAVWDGLDAWVQACAADRVPHPPATASLHESASANWPPSLPATTGLPRETGSAHSDWEPGPPHAPVPRAYAFLRIPSAPAVRSRSTDIVASRTTSGSARQNGRLLHPGI